MGVGLSDGTSFGSEEEFQQDLFTKASGITVRPVQAQEEQTPEQSGKTQIPIEPPSQFSGKDQMERQPPDTRDTMPQMMSPDYYMRNRMNDQDPRNIYNDQGDIVDYDMRGLPPPTSPSTPPPTMDPRSQSFLQQQDEFGMPRLQQASMQIEDRTQIPEEQELFRARVGDWATNASRNVHLLTGTYKEPPIPPNTPMGEELGTKDLDKMKAELPAKERFQWWPERMVRAGLAAAHNVMAGNTPGWSYDPDSGEFHTSPEMLESAKDLLPFAMVGTMPTRIGNVLAHEYGPGLTGKGLLNSQGKPFEVETPLRTTSESPTMEQIFKENPRLFRQQSNIQAIQDNAAQQITKKGFEYPELPDFLDRRLQEPFQKGSVVKGPQMRSAANANEPLVGDVTDPFIKSKLEEMRDTLRGRGGNSFMKYFRQLDELDKIRFADKMELSKAKGVNKMNPTELSRARVDKLTREYEAKYGQLYNKDEPFMIGSKEADKALEDAWKAEVDKHAKADKIIKELDALDAKWEKEGSLSEFEKAKYDKLAKEHEKLFPENVE